jgi:Domain of unknown function (DUF4157)
MSRSLQSQLKTSLPPGTDFSAVPTRVLQRVCACGQHTIGGGTCDKCSEKQQTIQRRPAHVGDPKGATAAVPSIVHETLRSPGQPLDAATRAFMEPRFGHDFSQVRVHTDTKAAESAQAVNALAYTVGQDVVFGHGEYRPSTASGRHLLGHELAHVVQQSRQPTVPSQSLVVGLSDSSAEREADKVADSVVSPFASGAKESTVAATPGHSKLAEKLSPTTTQSSVAGRLQRAVRANNVSCRTPSAAIAAVTGPDPVATITAADARAIELLDTVIDTLETNRNAILGGASISFPTISDNTAQALQNRFGLDPTSRAVWTGRGPGSVHVLIRRFRMIRGLLDSGGVRYTCLAPANINSPPCVGPGCGGQTRAVSCEGVSRLFLCTPWWSDSADDQAATILHESFHIFFGFINDVGHLGNAHCYEQFVLDLNGLTVAPLFAGSCPP